MKRFFRCPFQERGLGTLLCCHLRMTSSWSLYMCRLVDPSKENRGAALSTLDALVPDRIISIT